MIELRICRVQAVCVCVFLLLTPSSLLDCDPSSSLSSQQLTGNFPSILLPPSIFFSSLPVFFDLEASPLIPPPAEALIRDPPFAPSSVYNRRLQFTGQASGAVIPRYLPVLSGPVPQRRRVVMVLIMQEGACVIN